MHYLKKIFQWLLYFLARFFHPHITKTLLTFRDAFVEITEVDLFPDKHSTMAELCLCCWGFFSSIPIVDGSTRFESHHAQLTHPMLLWLQPNCYGQCAHGHFQRHGFISKLAPYFQSVPIR